MQKLKIAYYLGDISSSGGGVFSYLMGLLKLMSSSSEIETIHIFYLESEVNDAFNEFKKNTKIKFHQIRKSRHFYFLKNISTIFYTASLFSESKKVTWLLLRLSKLFNPYKIINKISAKENIKLIHVPFQISPLYNISIPVITTMHDVQELHLPNFFNSQERMRRSIFYKQALEDSDHIIVSFNHIKHDLIKYFSIPEKQISVATIPLTGSYFDTAETKLEINTKAILHTYNLPDEFVLYPATTWPHKNHINLIKAISLLKTKGDKINLVCTGSKTDFYKKIEETINELGINNQVFFLGMIPQQHLVLLYKLAKLVVIPSLYEAGSGPLLEAMHYKTPVICSNTTVLPEHIGNIDFIFNANKIDAIAELIQKGIHDNIFIKKNIENSILRNSYFKNMEYENDFIRAYKKTINNNK